jgi:hypothetical protein
MSEPKKKRLTLSVVMRESRELMWRHRRSLGIGMALMLVSRIAGLNQEEMLKSYDDKINPINHLVK